MIDEVLEARCRETDAADDYAVYGDWLEERGDPRGKLIALQLAGLDPGDLLVALGPPPHVEVTWHNGFWGSIRLRSDAVDLAAVLAHESARLAKALVLDLHPTSNFDIAVFVRGPAVDAGAFAAMSSLVRRDRDGQAWMAALPAIRRLGLTPDSLGLANVSLDEARARTIASIGGLRDLYLGAPHRAPRSISRAALHALAPLAASLVDLEVHDCRNFDDEICAMVSTFTHLEELRVCGSEITAAGLRDLAKLPRLRQLDVSGCEYVDDECGDIIGTFPAIETVSIKSTAMTAWGVKGIARSRTIGKLVLDVEQYPEEIESVLGIELADR